MVVFFYTLYSCVCVFQTLPFSVAINGDSCIRGYQVTLLAVVCVTILIYQVTQNVPTRKPNLEKNGCVLWTHKKLIFLKFLFFSKAASVNLEIFYRVFLKLSEELTDPLE